MVTAGSNIRGRRNTWRRRVHGPGSGNQGRGRHRHGGTWWDRVYKRIVVEGKDFVQDTQDGVGDEFELIPDSDEEGDNIEGSSMVDNDDSFVPETEEQEIVPETELQQFVAKTEVQQTVAQTEMQQFVAKTEVHQIDAADDIVRKTEVSISDAETDDGVPTRYDEYGMDVRGISEAKDDREFKDKLTDLLCAFIPAYSKVVKRSSP